MRKFLSLLLLIIGVVVFVFGSHVANVAANGEATVEQVQENEPESTRPIVSPVPRGVRTQVTEASQQKIGQLEQKMTQSRVTANWLHGIGAALFFIGLGCLILSFSHKRRN